MAGTVKRHKWRSDACIIEYGFVAQKNKCWTRILQRNAYFIQPYLIKVIRLQDISKTC